jgi:hypothetical protein
VRSFADIPDHVGRRVRAGEPILLILLDAFGRVFLERHREHPLLSRLAITDLVSQFPSTTTAHVTTLHFGLPVAEHGLYEWAVLEPALNTIINPLPFRRAGDEGREGLAGQLDPRRLLDAPTFYAALDAPAVVIQPVGIASSSYTRLACAGAEVRGSDDLGASVRTLANELATGQIAYGHIYWPDIDSISHLYGPDAPEVDAVIRSALDAIAGALEGAGPGVTVMLTADHGHIGVSPGRIDLLDRLWPELPRHLSQSRPAGSPRDPFLHVRPESVGHVIEQLSERLGDRATVRPAAELFAAVGPRLSARLGDVVLLPVPGRSAWLSTAPTPSTNHLGSHGGLTEAETATYLAELIT